MNRFILLNVNDPNDGFGHTVVGVVEMTPELAKLILSRAEMAKEAKKQDDKFTRIEFYDRHVGYFEADVDVLDTETCEILASDLPVYVPEHPFGDDDENTEYDVMAVDTDSVWWRTSSKHSEVMATACPIPISDIETFATGG